MEEFFKIAFSKNFDYKAAQEYVVNKVQIYTLYVTAIYIITIFSIRIIMANFKPFQVKTAMILWNGVLAIFSACGFYVTSQTVISEISRRGVIGSYTEYNNFFLDRSGYWAFMLMVSKTVELGDTLFLVFRKKPLIFLHWYHHALTFNYAIWAYTDGLPFNMYIAWINYGVHAIMYSYYFLRALNIRVPTVIARCITLLQIIQFVIMLLIIIHIGILRLLGFNVAFVRFSFFLCLFMELSYLLLFANFFYQAYIKNGGAKFIAEKKFHKFKSQ